MACELPGAHSPDALWRNLLAGRRYFRKAPPERIPPDYFDPDPDAPGKSYCDQMAVITDWAFDPVEFRIPPVTFQVTDMAHWLALYTARNALRDARLALDSLDRTRVGVVLGNSLTGEFSRSHNLRFRWPYVERSLRRALARHGTHEADARKLVAAVQQAYEAPLPEITEDTLAGNMANTIAGRICNYFDLGAGGFTVDGACSSSLLSVAMACNALADGEMDYALAGGVDVSLDPFEIVGFAKTRALATDDIRPYDARGVGMLTGEGCGLVVLAREADARAAGHTVRALVRGWGYSSDGHGGITAPEVEGQLRALRRAYARAGYSMSTVGLIEGHGTGTALGDKVELAAILRLLGEGAENGVCSIGSLKANIGHCKAAAGVAGLIKAVLALERKILPPTVNCEQPNPAFGSPMRRLRPSVRGRVWAPGAGPRRAAVSSMGFGGANSHVTLEEANPEATASPEDLVLLESQQSSELVVIAAEDKPSLRQSLAELLTVARRICRAELTDLSAALLQEAAQGPTRLAVVAKAPWELVDAVEQCLGKLDRGQGLAELDDPVSGIFAGEVGERPSVVALFPGQASQRLNMGEQWWRRLPWVREFYDQVATGGGDLEVVRSLRDLMFRDTLGVDEDTRRAWEKELRATQVAQPAIVLSSLAALRVLGFLGLVPDLVLGHSLGELSALAAAGVVDPLTAVRLAARRGQAMGGLQLADPGGMVAIAASADIVRPLIEPLGAALGISNFNSPRQTVVSGTTAAIAQIVRDCETRNLPCRPLPVSHAFHSEIIAPAAETFRNAVAEEIARTLDLQRGSADAPRWQLTDAGPIFISTVTAEPLGGQVDWAAYLATQIRQPVRFVEAVQRAARTGPALWVEVGPGGVLTHFLGEILGSATAPGFATDVAHEDGFHLLNRLLARAWVLGLPVRLDRLFAHRFHLPLDPKNYQPRFIVNPCERPVGPLEASPQPLLAAGAPGDAPSDRDALLGFAVEWISRRTGFPKSTIALDKRLRDDLNLDSIKVGELVLLLSRKVGRQFEGDPASASNARIGDLVEMVWMQAQQPSPRAAPSQPDQPATGPADSLAPWVCTFSVETVSEPLPEEAQTPWPREGACVVLAEPGSPRARVLAELLCELGLSARVVDVTSELPQTAIPTDLTTLIVLVPAAKQRFWDCDATALDQRVDGLAALLFRGFRWAGHGADLSQLRGLVLRSIPDDEDCGLDLDAGGGFLKALGLEYPGAQFKWLSLPSAWTPKRWAEVAVQELQAPRGQVAFSYSRAGERMTTVARRVSADMDHKARVSLGEKAGAKELTPSLGPDDVVLVSGGAKGITCELALGLATETGCRLALLGSSPLPPAATDPAGSELLRNLRRFEAAGIRHAYVQADVTDAGAVERAVRVAEGLLGSVTAILHGAGVTKFRLFREKELGEFLDCVRVKARGLCNLLAATSPARLKAVHVVSSVLGQTGMRGQADYAFANAWLDGAVASLRAAYPHIHCLSVGFSAWAETGIAVKSGALEGLNARGVTPLTIKAGVSAYLDLVRQTPAQSRFLVTGRLTEELEAMLHPSVSRAPRGRFLEHVRRCVPGVELVADATLSHETDLYLPEHIFEGTPVFPGVMAMEAMVQAAQACAGRDDLPALKNIEFRQPLIVPEGANVIMRTLALIPLEQTGVVRVRLAIRSDRDGFKQDHFEAEAVFGVESMEPPPLALPEPVPEPLSADPESFSPVPLFQGKFFRRIARIRKLALGDESLTEVQAPVGERYFGEAATPACATASPALRDALLQSGALILPPGCLPSRLGEVRWFRPPVPAENLLCATRVRQRSAEEFLVDLAAFDRAGRPVEMMRDVVLRLPRAPVFTTVKTGPKPLDPSRLSSDLQALWPNTPHAVALVAHAELQEAASLQELTPEERERVKTGTAPARQTSRLANWLAARRVALAFGRRHRQLDFPASEIALGHQADGKPQLLLASRPVEAAFQGQDISLADGAGWSIAWLGAGQVGVDLEWVEQRDAETWQGLLGKDGYALARRISAQTGEPFDCAATRVWTLFEAGKKASGLKRITPAGESSVGGPWLALHGETERARFEFLCATMKLAEAEPRLAALCLARRLELPPGVVATTRGDPVQAHFESIVEEFQTEMERLRPLCARDPEAAGADTRHAEFLRVIAHASGELKQLEKTSGAGELLHMRERFQGMLAGLLEGSQNFRQSLAKPLGYAGDYRLLEMLADDRATSQGLAWHFDRSQLESQAAVACRHRIAWACEELGALTRRSAKRPLCWLDLGIGAAPVEHRWAEQHPDVAARLHAVDFEPAALRRAAEVFSSEHRVVVPWPLNLRDPKALAKVEALAGEADACIALGMLEALSDAEALRLLRAVLRGLARGAFLCAENFVPDHTMRSVMEWFMDFHLCYRSCDQLRTLIRETDIAVTEVEASLDPTGSLARLKVIR